MESKLLPGYKILEADDVRRDLEHIQIHGWPRGMYVGFPAWEPHYNMLPGIATDWIGYPQSGKTEICLEVLLFTSLHYECVHMLWCPDIGKSVDLMIKLIHKHTGKTFKKQYANYIELDEIWKATPFLFHHFKIIHPQASGKTRPRPMSPEALWEYAAEYSLKNRLDTVLIDSWKDMKHDYAAHGGSYAPYLSYILPLRNMIAEQSGLHLHTIVHPKNPENDKSGKIRPPRPQDIEGGAQWNNSGKCIIAAHRESWDDTSVDIYFRKIKPENVGYPTGKPKVLNFDRTLSRYYWIQDLGDSLVNVYAEPKDSKSYQEYTKTPRVSSNLEAKPTTAFYEKEEPEAEEGTLF
jgi:hypothetical protein